MKKNLKRAFTSLLAAAALLALAACSNGQTAATPTPAPNQPTGTPAPAEEKLDFPKQDITVVVPYAAGGNTDLMARALCTKLGEITGVNVIVQNIEGGGGTIGTSQVVNGKPDGYTLVIPANSAYIVSPEVNEVGYHWDTTTPICIVSEANFGIAVAASSPYQTLQDLLDAAAANPGGVTYVTPGPNTAGHLLVAAIGQAAEVEWNHSPNNSAPAAIAELIGGHTDAYCSNLSVFKSGLESGELRLLVVTGDERDPKYPDVPTAKELGYEYPFSVYFGIVGPDGMDEKVVQYLSDAVGEALEDAEVKDAFAKLDQPIRFQGAEEFAARLPEDVDLYQSILKAIGAIS